MKLGLGIGLILISFTNAKAQLGIEHTTAIVQTVNATGRAGTLVIQSSGKTASFIVVGGLARVQVGTNIDVTVTPPAREICPDCEPCGIEVTLTVVAGDCFGDASCDDGFHTVITSENTCLL